MGDDDDVHPKHQEAREMYGLGPSRFTKWLLIILALIFWPIALFIILVAMMMFIASG